LAEAEVDVFWAVAEVRLLKAGIEELGGCERAFVESKTDRIDLWVGSILSPGLIAICFTL
jgi:hypothetical protein